MQDKLEMETVVDKTVKLEPYFVEAALGEVYHDEKNDDDIIENWSPCKIELKPSDNVLKLLKQKSFASQTAIIDVDYVEENDKMHEESSENILDHGDKMK